MRTLYLANLQIEVKKRMGQVEINMEENGINMQKRMRHMENMMGHMENTIGHMENNIMESIVKFIQSSEENISKGDDVAYGTQEDKDSAYVDQLSINKPTLRGFDSSNGIYQG